MYAVQVGPPLVTKTPIRVYVHRIKVVAAIELILWKTISLSFIHAFFLYLVYWSPVLQTGDL